jgi:uncharacterized protein (DUF736 family)
MPTIGTFTKAGEIFTGTILTLTLNVTVNIVAADRGSDQSPDYRIYWGSVDCGAAWKRVNDAGRDFLSVKLDDPAFPYPVYASLFADEDPDIFNLVWSRPKGR